MKKRMKRLLALLLSAGLVLSAAGCGKEEEPGVSNPGQESRGTAAGSTKQADNGAAREVTAITLYLGDANTPSGVVGGWKGECFASLGLELEIWAYSDEKTNAILASGDLPDIMVIPDTSVEDMIEGGMLLDLDEYLDQMPHVGAFEGMETALNYVREYKSAGTGKVYGLPQGVGDRSTKNSLVDSTDRRAVKLKWDIYEKIGAPEINSFDDLIDVMEQMLEACPEDADGVPYYGTILNNGSDSKYWQCISLWYQWQGIGEDHMPYLLETNMIDGTTSTILTKDSVYYAGLKWYNKVYRRGLMDPDSINNDRPTQKAKVDAGYAMVPSGYLPGWASGNYYEYYIPGTQIYYSYVGSKYGGQLVGINAKTENLDACLAFLDAMADPDVYRVIVNGPEGDYWYNDGNGNQFFTEEALEWLTAKANGEELDSFVVSTGEPLELFPLPWLMKEGEYTPYQDGNGNNRIYAMNEWTERQQILVDNDNFKKWSQTTGYDSWKDWLNEYDAYCSESPLEGVSSFYSQPDAAMQLTVDALKDIVVTASWKMVYAESDSEFDGIWEQMVADCEGLGAQDVQKWRLEDIDNAIAIRDSLEAN